MSHFVEMVNSPTNSKLVVQGNVSFALGVIHAGYHAADGYPGTPSTEVIDKALNYVQDRIKVGWSVNEAVAVSLAVGHAIAGSDVVVTMKIPGVFQAADAITTSAFYNAPAGALVIYAATDYVPSSTQHVIDARYFFASARIPVLEPRNHQEMYEIACSAADISRKFNTPVVVLASGILAHSEGLITTKAPRLVEPRKIPDNLNPWMLLPTIARENYNIATTERIPDVQKWYESSHLITEIDNGFDSGIDGEGDNASVDESSDKNSDEKKSWGIIVAGDCEIIVNEALAVLRQKPSILSISAVYPIPEDRIKKFAEKVSGKLFIIENGDKFLQEKISLLGLSVVGKDKFSTITQWTCASIINHLTKHLEIPYSPNQSKKLSLQPVKRPPIICPGCPYRGFALVVKKLKKKKKLYASFGDIGCSTLIYFLNGIDTVSCMGASDSMRQGFVISRPEMASKTISVIGDSCECHSGLDSTRNAVFRKVPGVKVILDNRTTAMTGGQPAPSSIQNLAGQNNYFNLLKAVEAENERTLKVDAFDMKQIEHELLSALELAEKGVYSTIIVEGPCIREVDRSKKALELEIDLEKCKKCGLCDVCSGIELNEDKIPKFTELCANCGSLSPICQQTCPFNAIVPIDHIIPEVDDKRIVKSISPQDVSIQDVSIEEKKDEVAIKEVRSVSMDKLPSSIRLAIRGVGGQGNLFFGKVLSKVAFKANYDQRNIVKGDTHGMAQLGGSVISTFSCGEVYSPILAPYTADVLVVMEASEVLRSEFLDLLKPQGTIILNNFKALPINVKREVYPLVEQIDKVLAEYKVIKVDANKIMVKLGDKYGKASNVLVLGILSTVSPFDLISEELWVNSLKEMPYKESINTANIRAFKKGRSFKES